MRNAGCVVINYYRKKEGQIMAEVKNTRKKPVAKKPANNAADTAEELKKTAPETAATAEQPIEQAVQEKPAKKKSSKQPEKTTISEQQEGIAAAVTDEDTENTESKEAENATQLPAENVEQPVAAEEQKADESAAAAEEVQKADLPDEQKERAAQSKESAKTSGKKFALSKNMIIILSCVLAVVIIGVILAVCLTSCKSGGDNNKKYTVTFIVDGEVMTTYKLSAGEKISEPKNNPTKDMFAFDGWYLVNSNNSSQRQKFVFGTTVSQNITLVAIFNGESSVKVEFDPNGGAFADDKQVELIGIVGDSMTEPADEPTRVGYLFSGWYTEAQCYNEFDFSAYPVENFTLYAGWTKDTENYVYVSYYGNGELLLVDPVRKDENVVIPDFFGDKDDIVVGDWLIRDTNTVYTANKATDDIYLEVYYYTNGLEFSITKTNATVTRYDGMATDVIVPSKFEGKTVTGIGSYAFYRTSGLPAVTSVQLPNTIATIGEGAFYDCQYLASVNLTYSVNTIGENAFYRNIRLRSVGDISGVEDNKLGKGAFNGCKELRKITLGNLLTKIGDYTFNACASLTEVTFPDALIEIGEYAFSGCTGLTSVNLESLILESIADNAFADCTGLTSVNVSKTSGEVAMQGNPFAGCHNVTVYVPSTLLDDYTNNTNNSQFKDKFAAR